MIRFAPKTASRVRTALASCGFGLALLGALPGPTSSALAAEPLTKIRIVSLNSIPGFLIWAAKELGYYKEEGLDVVSLTFYPNGPASVAAGYAGAWDAAYLGGPPAINAGAKFGLLVAGILDWQQSNYKVYVRKNVPTTNLREYLTGKTALTITASNLQFFLDACLRFHKVDPSTVRMVNLTPPNIVTAANGGQGEIISDWAPFTSTLEETGEYRAICEDNKQVGIETFDAYVIHPKFAKENPKAAAAFLRAVYRVNNEVTHNFDAMLKLSQKYFDEIGVKLTPEQIKSGFEVETYPSIDESIVMIKSGKIKRAMEASAKFLTSIGAMEKVPEIDFITAEYLEAAKTATK